MKFRANEFELKKAERKTALIRAKIAIRAESSDKSIHCLVDSRGLHLTFGRKCVIIKPVHAIKLAQSILREMKV